MFGEYYVRHTGGGSHGGSADAAASRDGRHADETAQQQQNVPPQVEAMDVVITDEPGGPTPHRSMAEAGEAAAAAGEGEKSRRKKHSHQSRRYRAVSDVVRQGDEEAGHYFDDDDDANTGEVGSPLVFEARRQMRGAVGCSPTGPSSPSRRQRGRRSSSCSSCSSSSSSDRGEALAGDAAAGTPSGLLGFLRLPFSRGGAAAATPESTAKGTTNAPRRHPCQLLRFVPLIAIVAFASLFLWVAFSSGQANNDAVSSPRAVLIIVEGFSGQIFTEMMNDGNGVHLPHIKRLLGGRGGVWSHCPQVTDSRCARSVSVEEEVRVRGRQLQMDSSGNVVQTSTVTDQEQERFSVYSATSIASILSGVTPSRHLVQNNSLASMFRYAQTSKTYPSVAKIVKDAGLQVTVLGTSHLLNSLSSTTYSCTQPGVLDMECPAESVSVPEGVEESTQTNPALGGTITTLECMATSSCNTDARRTKLPTNPREMSNSGIPEEQYRRILRDVFGSASQEKHNAASPSSSSSSSSSGSNGAGVPVKASELYLFHFDSLAVRSESPYLPNFAYNASSEEYVAQAYLIDSLIGQILAYVEDKSIQERENWLVVGVSDHGGNGKNVNADENPPPVDDASASSGSESGNQNGVSWVSMGLDDTQLQHLLHASVVPFFMSTFTTSSSQRSYITLKPLERPTSQLDVLPTILRWLNVAPFDDETEAAWAAEQQGGQKDMGTTSTGAQVEAAAARSSSGSVKPLTLEGKLAWRRLYEGAVQGICSSGVQPLDCYLLCSSTGMNRGRKVKGKCVHHLQKQQENAAKKQDNNNNNKRISQIREKKETSRKRKEVENKSRGQEHTQTQIILLPPPLPHSNSNPCCDSLSLSLSGRSAPLFLRWNLLLYRLDAKRKKKKAIYRNLVVLNIKQQTTTKGCAKQRLGPLRYNNARFSSLFSSFFFFRFYFSHTVCLYVKSLIRCASPRSSRIPTSPETQPLLDISFSVALSSFFYPYSHHRRVNSSLQDLYYYRSFHSTHTRTIRNSSALAINLSYVGFYLNLLYYYYYLRDRTEQLLFLQFPDHPPAGTTSLSPTRKRLRSTSVEGPPPLDPDSGPTDTHTAPYSSTRPIEEEEEGHAAAHPEISLEAPPREVQFTTNTLSSSPYRPYRRFRHSPARARLQREKAAFVEDGRAHEQVHQTVEELRSASSSLVLSTPESSSSSHQLPSATYPPHRLSTLESSSSSGGAGGETLASHSSSLSGTDSSDLCSLIEAFTQEETEAETEVEGVADLFSGLVSPDEHAILQSLLQAQREQRQQQQQQQQQQQDPLREEEAEEEQEEEGGLPPPRGGVERRSVSALSRTSAPATPQGVLVRPSTPSRSRTTAQATTTRSSSGTEPPARSLTASTEPRSSQLLPPQTPRAIRAPLQLASTPLYGTRRSLAAAAPLPPGSTPASATSSASPRLSSSVLPTSSSRLHTPQGTSLIAFQTSPPPLLSRSYYSISRQEAGDARSAASDRSWAQQHRGNIAPPRPQPLFRPSAGPAATRTSNDSAPTPSRSSGQLFRVSRGSAALSSGSLTAVSQLYSPDRRTTAGEEAPLLFHSPSRTAQLPLQRRGEEEDIEPTALAATSIEEPLRRPKDAPQEELLLVSDAFTRRSTSLLVDLHGADPPLSSPSNTHRLSSAVAELTEERSHSIRFVAPGLETVSSPPSSYPIDQQEEEEPGLHPSSRSVERYSQRLRFTSSRASGLLSELDRLAPTSPPNRYPTTTTATTTSLSAGVRTAPRSPPPSSSAPVNRLGYKAADRNPSPSPSATSFPWNARLPSSRTPTTTTMNSGQPPSRLGVPNPPPAAAGAGSNSNSNTPTKPKIWRSPPPSVGKTLPESHPTPLPTRAAPAYYTVGQAMDLVAAQCQRRGLQHAALWLSELSLDAVEEVLAAPIVATSASSGSSRSPGAHASSAPAKPWPAATLALDDVLLGDHERDTPAPTNAEVERPTAEEEAAAALQLELLLRNDYLYGAWQGILHPLAASSEGHPSTLKTAVGRLHLLQQFRERLTRHHRAALALMQNREYQRCHHLLSRLEQQLQAEAAATTTVVPSAAPPPLLPSCLQFIRLYALFLDGEKARLTNRGRAAAESAGSNAAASAPGGMAAPVPGVGGVGVGASVSALTGSGWMHPSLRELRSLLHAALDRTAAPAAGSTPLFPDTGSSPTRNAGTAPAYPTAASLDVASSTRHRPDPYLLWLLGVVLRELQAPPHEYTSFLYASLAVNPLFFSAWEDLRKSTESEADVAAAVRRLGKVRPTFMLNMFAAGVRTTLGTLPMNTDGVVSRGPTGSTSPLTPAPSTTTTTTTTDPSGSRSAGGGLLVSPPLISAGAGPAPPALPSHERGAAAAAAAAPVTYNNAWALLLMQFPNNSYLLIQLAEALYYLEKNATQAERIYTALQQQDPYRLDYTPMYSNLLFLKPDALGLCSLAQKVYRIDPFRPESNIVVGNYYCSIRQHERSILHFRRALAVDPTVVTAWTLLGQAYLEFKNIQSALDAFRCAVELDQRDYRGWYNLGHSYELLSVYHRARYYYGRAAQLRPTDPRMWRAMASCFQKERQEVAALQCLERAEACEEPSWLPLLYATGCGGPSNAQQDPRGSGSTGGATREYIGILEDLAEFYRSNGVRALKERKDIALSYRLLRRAGVYFHKLFSVLGGSTSSYAQPVALRLSDTFALSARALLLATSRGERGGGIEGGEDGGASLPLPPPGTAGSTIRPQPGGRPSEDGAKEDVERLIAFAEEWLSVVLLHPTDLHGGSRADAEAGEPQDRDLPHVRLSHGGGQAEDGADDEEDSQQQLPPPRRGQHSSAGTVAPSSSTDSSSSPATNSSAAFLFASAPAAAGRPYSPPPVPAPAPQPSNPEDTPSSSLQPPLPRSRVAGRLGTGRGGSLSGSGASRAAPSAEKTGSPHPQQGGQRGRTGSKQERRRRMEQQAERITALRDEIERLFASI
eukprot:gene12220-8409_t